VRAGNDRLQLQAKEYVIETHRLVSVARLSAAAEATAATSLVNGSMTAARLNAATVEH
jgi:hypothetical protein